MTGLFATIFAKIVHDVFWSVLKPKKWEELGLAKRILTFLNKHRDKLDLFNQHLIQYILIELYKRLNFLP